MFIPIISLGGALALVLTIITIYFNAQRDWREEVEEIYTPILNDLKNNYSNIKDRISLHPLHIRWGSTNRIISSKFYLIDSEIKDKCQDLKKATPPYHQKLEKAYEETENLFSKILVEANKGERFVIQRDSTGTHKQALISFVKSKKWGPNRFLLGHKEPNNEQIKSFKEITEEIVNLHPGSPYKFFTYLRSKMLKVPEIKDYLNYRRVLLKDYEELIKKLENIYVSTYLKFFWHKIKKNFLGRFNRFT